MTVYRGKESKPLERCKKNDEKLKLARQEINLRSSISCKYKWSVSMKPESEF